MLLNIWRLRRRRKSTGVWEGAVLAVNGCNSVLETAKREEAEVRNDSVCTDIGPMGPVSIHPSL